MKKLLNAVAIIATILILSSQTVSAQTFTTELADVLPSTTDMVYETSTQVDNPLEELMVEALSNSGILFEGSAESVAILEIVLANTTLSMGLDIEEGFDPTYNDPNTYVSFNISEEDFNSLLELVVTPPTEESYEGHTIYTIETGAHIVHLGDLLVITNTPELAKGLNIDIGPVFPVPNEL